MILRVERELGGHGAPGGGGAGAVRVVRAGVPVVPPAPARAAPPAPSLTTARRDHPRLTGPPAGRARLSSLRESAPRLSERFLLNPRWSLVRSSQSLNYASGEYTPCYYLFSPDWFTKAHLSLHPVTPFEDFLITADLV